MSGRRAVTAQARSLTARWSANQLLRGSVNLVANNVAATGLGFVSWVVTTRIFSVGDVGLAAATISLGSLLANLAFLGAPGTLLRFLPGSADRTRLLMTALSVSLGTATVIALGAAVLLAHGSETSGGSLLPAGVFVLFVVALVAKAVTEAATIAARASQVALSATIAGNVAKLAALGLLGWLAAGAVGILTAQLAAVLVNVVALVKSLRSSGLLRGRATVDLGVLKQVGGYAGSSYVNAIAGGLPLLLLPVLVKSSLGNDSAGYWYVASLIATAMSLVSSAVAQSLLVEASHDTAQLRRLAWRAFRWLTWVSLPLAAVALLIAPWLLGIFGSGYATASLAAFRVLAVSSLFSPAIYVLGTVFFVRRRIVPLFVGNVVNAIVVLVLAGRATGLVGVAWAWMVGELLYVALFLVFLPVFRERAPRPGPMTTPTAP